MHGQHFDQHYFSNKNTCSSFSKAIYIKVITMVVEDEVVVEDAMDRHNCTEKTRKHLVLKALVTDRCTLR